MENFKEHIIRKLADSIAWRMIGGQNYIARRLCLRESSRPTLKASSLASVLNIVNEYNDSNPLGFALISDITSFVQLIHIDVKKLARFRKVGHRITGNRQQGRSAGVGYDRVHVAIDDATRLAYVEVLADEQKATAIGFLSRTVAWFNGKGVECR